MLGATGSLPASGSGHRCETQPRKAALSSSRGAPDPPRGRPESLSPARAKEPVSPSALLAWKVALRAGVSPSLPSLACPSSAWALPPPTQLAARPRLGCPCVSSLLTPRLPSVLLRPPGRTTPLSGGAGLVGTTGHTRGTSRGCAQRWIYFRVTRTEPSVKWTGFIAKHRLPQFPREADPRRAPLRRRPRRGPAAC